MKWEYTTIQLVAIGFEDAERVDEYQRIMNVYGQDGWEMISAAAYNSGMVNGQIMVLFFKRTLDASPKPPE
jgi:hypothetical protein